MINKRINGNKYIRKKIGGAGDDQEYNPRDNIMIVYNLFSYLLLYISYILFGIATIIFLNASLNFKYVIYDNYEKEKNNQPIFLDKPIFLDQPIFEYLKPNNFMYIDDYLLDKNSPIFITIVSILIFSIVAIAIIFGIIRSKILGDIDNPIKDVWNTLLFKLALIPYIFIFIIIILYNENKKNNNYELTKNKYNEIINYTIYEGNYTESYLIILKNKIINILEKGLWDNYITNDNTGKNFFDFLSDTDKTKFANEIKNITDEVVEDGKQNILKKLFLIYKDGHEAEANSKYVGDEKKKRINDYKIKYIKHINDYFELLIREKNNNTDFYRKYYIFGLANKYSPSNTLNDKFNNLLVYIADKVKSYFIVIFTFYPLLFLIIAPVIIYHHYPDKTKNFIIDSLYYFDIGKIILSLCIFIFIIYFILYYNKKIS